MLQLIKNIQGNFYDNTTGNVVYLKSISAELQQEDYINVYGLVAYLQNLTRAEQTSALTKPLLFGLKNNRNLPVRTLNIDY
jgi:hypothetical protein